MITLEFNLFVLILKSLAQIDGSDLLLVYTDIIVGKTCQYSCRNAKQGAEADGYRGIRAGTLVPSCGGLAL
jgi:hypothetical protein